MCEFFFFFILHIPVLRASLSHDRSQVTVCETSVLGGREAEDRKRNERGNTPRIQQYPQYIQVFLSLSLTRLAYNVEREQRVEARGNELREREVVAQLKTHTLTPFSSKLNLKSIFFLSRSASMPSIRLPLRVYYIDDTLYIPLSS